MSIFVGIDCGASNLRIGLVSSDGRLIQSVKQKSPLKTQPSQLATIVKEQVDHLINLAKLTSPDLKALTIGTPGPINFVQGVILASANLGNNSPIEIIDPLSDQFDIPVYLERDTNLALLGEKWQGLAQNCQDCLMLSLGTGVGGAILIDGKLYKGHGGKAGEIGHIYLENRHFPAQKNLPSCGLGHAGCFESYIQHNPSNEHPFYIGQALASLVDIFNPEKIILGGGRTKEIEPNLDQITHVMKTQALTPSSQEAQILISQLGDDAGLLGGAYLARTSFSTV